MLRVLVVYVVTKVLLELVVQVLLVSKDHQDHLVVLLEQQVLQVVQDQLAHKGLQVRKVLLELVVQGLRLV